MITAKNLIKTYKKNRVISDVSLDIPKGIIFGLLGPNGAGKTTLIRIMSGILKADSGSVLIGGESVENAKKKFGYVSQYFGQYEELTVWENALFYAQMYGVKDNEKVLGLLERYNLLQYQHKPAGSLSGGYKRRLALVCALSHDPDVLFLDEPTAGIDPVTRKLLWDDFYALSQEGKTLFVTTHYMEEAQRCHELAFLAEGEIVARGTPRSIKNSLKGVKLYSARLAYSPLISQYLSSYEGVVLINQFGDELRLILKDDCDLKGIADILAEQLDFKDTLIEGEINLEDLFIVLTQGDAQ